MRIIRASNQLGDGVNRAVLLDRGGMLWHVHHLFFAAAENAGTWEFYSTLQFQRGNALLASAGNAISTVILGGFSSSGAGAIGYGTYANEHFLQWLGMPIDDGIELILRHDVGANVMSTPRTIVTLYMD